MVKQQKKGQEPIEEQKKPVVTFTAEEVGYRDDLMQKLLTLNHVKSILVSTGDSVIFIRQIEDLASLVEGWIEEQIRMKRVEFNVQSDVPPKDQTNPTPQDGTATPGNDEADDPDNQ